MTVWGAGIGAAISIGGSIFGASKAKRERRRAERKGKRLTAKIEHLEKNRTKIVNPFEGITDISGMASDLSAMASAPKMNLAVATQAAEMQAQESDIALANTLDILAASGASAGGATALAQMALKSKQGISASIEQQEARNQETMEKSRVEGELRIQGIKMSEAKRMQDVKMSQAEKVQTAEAKGKEFVYREEDSRDMQKLNRLSAQLSGADQQAAAARASGTAAISAGIGAVGNIAGSVASG
tara:strand:- start:1030 stop:1758 length:729 start_codon:yes stop_codon:yes gene_type:complete